MSVCCVTMLILCVLYSSAHLVIVMVHEPYTHLLRLSRDVQRQMKISYKWIAEWWVPRNLSCQSDIFSVVRQIACNTIDSIINSILIDRACRGDHFNNFCFSGHIFNATSYVVDQFSVYFTTKIKQTNQISLNKNARFPWTQEEPTAAADYW